jgi:GTP-binding protein Era
LTRGETQIVFIDTPGIHQPKTKLSEYMIREINEGVADVDVAVMVTDPSGDIRPAEMTLIEGFRARKATVILAMNKIDTLKQKELMMEKIQKLADLFPFEHIVPISALTGDGVAELLGLIEKHAEPGPHFFDDDTYTDQPERIIAAEIIREKLLRNLRDEIPHGVAVGIEEMKEREDADLVDLSATIYCEKATHKGIIIGKQGAMLKKIATESRHEIERFLGVKVNLKCWVKIKEDWRNKEGMLREIGFR